MGFVIRTVRACGLIGMLIGLSADGPLASSPAAHFVVVARWTVAPSGETTDVHDVMAFELPLRDNPIPTYTRHIEMPVERGSLNGVAVDSKGDVYVCREHETPVGVDVYPPGTGVDPRPLRHISVQSPDHQHDCRDIAIDGNDNLYVLNSCCQVVVYPPGAGTDTQPMRVITDRGAERFAIDAAGKVYILLRQSVDVFGSASTPERSFTLILPRPLIYFSDLAVGPDGQVYVASPVNIDVYASDASGNSEPIRSLDTNGANLAIDSNDNLYVLTSDPTNRSTSMLLIFNAGAQGDAQPAEMARFSGSPEGLALSLQRHFAHEYSPVQLSEERRQHLVDRREWAKG
jgi:hypothetical protein